MSAAPTRRSEAFKLRGTRNPANTTTRNNRNPRAAPAAEHPHRPSNQHVTNRPAEVKPVEALVIPTPHIVPTDFPHKVYYSRDIVARFKKDGYLRYSISAMLALAHNPASQAPPPGMKQAWRAISASVAAGPLRGGRPPKTQPQEERERPINNADTFGDSAESAPEWMMGENNNNNSSSNEDIHQAFDMEKFKEEMRRKEGLEPVRSSSASSTEDLTIFGAVDVPASQPAAAESSRKSRFVGRFFNTDEVSEKEHPSQPTPAEIAKNAPPNDDEIMRILQQSAPFADGARSGPNIPTSVLRRLSSKDKSSVSPAPKPVSLPKVTEQSTSSVKNDTTAQIQQHDQQHRVSPTHEQHRPEMVHQIPDRSMFGMQMGPNGQMQPILPPPHMLPPLYLAHLMASGLYGPVRPPPGMEMPSMMPPMMQFMPPFPPSMPPGFATHPSQISQPQQQYQPTPAQMSQQPVQQQNQQQHHQQPAPTKQKKQADNITKWFPGLDMTAVNAAHQRMKDVVITGRALTLEEVEAANRR